MKINSDIDWPTGTAHQFDVMTILWVFSASARVAAIGSRIIFGQLIYYEDETRRKQQNNNEIWMLCVCFVEANFALHKL